MPNPSAKWRMGNTTTIGPPSGVETMIIVCSTTTSSNSGASSGEPHLRNARVSWGQHEDLTWLGARNGVFGGLKRKSLSGHQTWFADCSRLMSWWLWRLRQSSWIVSNLGIVGLKLPVLLAPRETQAVAKMSASKRERKWRTAVLCTKHGMRSTTGQSVSTTANTVVLFLTCKWSLKRLNLVRWSNRYLYYHSEKKYWTLGIGSTREDQNEWYLRSAPTDCYSPLVAPWLDSKHCRYRPVVPHELDVNGYPEPDGGRKTKYKKVGCCNWKLWFWTSLHKLS